MLGYLLERGQDGCFLPPSVFTIRSLLKVGCLVRLILAIEVFDKYCKNQSV